MGAPTAAARPLVRAAARSILRQQPTPTTTTTTTTTLVQRRFAGGHGPAIAHTVNESFGTSFWILLAAIPTFTLGYRLTRPGENGEVPTLTRWLTAVGPSAKEMRDFSVQTISTKQNVSDGKLLLLSAKKDEVYESRDPDMWDRHSRRNRPASSYVNMDAAKDVYRRRYFAEVDRHAELAQKRANQQN